MWMCQRNIASHTPPTGNGTCNPGMCPDWESNQRPLALQDDAQPTEPCQSGLFLILTGNCEVTEQCSDEY